MSREAERRSTTLFVFADAGTRWDVRGGGKGGSSILQYASKTKTESLCPSTKYEMSKSYELLFFFFVEYTNTKKTQKNKKQNTHTQKNTRAARQRSQGLSADERVSSSTVCPAV